MGFKYVHNDIRYPGHSVVCLCVSVKLRLFGTHSSDNKSLGNSSLMSLLPTKLLMSWEDITADHRDVRAERTTSVFYRTSQAVAGSSQVVHGLFKKLLVAGP